jgi:hypothetical protein
MWEGKGREGIGDLDMEGQIIRNVTALNTWTT